MRMKQKDLMARIPPDVLARARKCGATKVDWYAGRLLDDGAVRSFEPSPQLLRADHALLLANHKKMRKEWRRHRRDQRYASLARLWQRMMSRAAPSAG